MQNPQALCNRNIGHSMSFTYFFEFSKYFQVLVKIHQVSEHKHGDYEDSIVKERAGIVEVQVSLYRPLHELLISCYCLMTCQISFNTHL